MSAHGHDVEEIGVEEFVGGLDSDEVAAVELLGELPPEKTKGGPRIRIPNNFPITEGERQAEFFLRAQGVGLLYPVGTNRECGVLSLVWELRAETYERVMQMMTTLGRSSACEVNYSGDTTTEDSASESETNDSAAPPEATAPETAMSVPQLRELWSEAKARRAAAQAESQELGTQYRATTAEIAETAKSLAELRERLAVLHQHRLSLKRRLKTANVSFTDACIDAKRRSKALAQAERVSLDRLATTAAEILRDEAKRCGVSLDQALALIRKKLTTA